MIEAALPWPRFGAGGGVNTDEMLGA